MHILGLILLYYFLRRCARAYRVTWLLLKDRDLARQIPKSYLGEMVRTNRWVQLQICGFFGWLGWGTLGFVLPDDFPLPIISLCFFIGIAGLSANMVRLLTSRWQN